MTMAYNRFLLLWCGLPPWLSCISHRSLAACCVSSLHKVWYQVLINDHGIIDFSYYDVGCPHGRAVFHTVHWPLAASCVSPLHKVWYQVLINDHGIIDFSYYDVGCPHGRAVFHIVQSCISHCPLAACCFSPLHKVWYQVLINDHGIIDFSYYDVGCPHGRAVFHTVHWPLAVSHHFIRSDTKFSLMTMA